MNGSVERIGVLRSLLELNRPLTSILRDLAGVTWDTEAEVVTLQPEHLMGVLSRFRDGSLNANDVEVWANAIEGREDVSFELKSEALLKDAIFDLANPILQSALTYDIADRWLERLKAVRT